MSDSIYGAAHRIHASQRFTRWAFSQWIKFSLPLVRRMIEEERARESIYMRAYEGLLHAKGRSMTQDWRIYEMLTKENWRPGDEPLIENNIVIKYEGHEITIPLPKGGISVSVDVK